MTPFPKLPDKPGCLGFRKTIVLNKDEHRAMNYLLKDAIEFCNSQVLLKDSPTKTLFVGLQEKLSAATPPPKLT
jgi:hypothetical protein